MAKLLSGKEVTASLNEEIRKKAAILTAHQITPKPVSYTHLSRSERRLLRSVIRRLIMLPILPFVSGLNMMISSRPVSYTHLINK